MKQRRRKTSDSETTELLPCMDYLHGDVVDSEFMAACRYEYARESAILRKAAHLYNDPTTIAGEIGPRIDREFHCGKWFLEWLLILQCPSFPAKNWNKLTEKERAELFVGLPRSTNKVQPLALAELPLMTYYLNLLRVMADETKAKAIEWVSRGGKGSWQKVYPILELPNTPCVQELLPLDFSKSKKRLLQEIGKWLDLPENKARFVKYRATTEAGTTKEAKDRLKDLAAWRLCRERGWELALEFAEQHRKRDKSGRARAFHDPRQGQAEKVPLNEAPLYSEESRFFKAKARALKHRAELFPWEFGKHTEE
ncbi:MAG TPA: hypothetical protein VKE29_07580 [Candidatus Udaeobacter sp.]|nr:hypothetical protein [Candidatus Udaeobacter sp.]